MEDNKKNHQHHIKVELYDTVGHGEYVNFEDSWVYSNTLGVA